MMTPTPYAAPLFSLPDTNGRFHSLADYAGAWLVLYIYPMDDTPGCTIEACSFRDARDDISALGASVVGISADSQESHQSFTAGHDLNFTLLSDLDLAVIKAYGAYGPKMFGKPGIQRKTFIINPSGMVVKSYGRVTPLGHGVQIVADLQKLQES